MNGLKKILLMCFLFASRLSYGGGWTSGGGELIRDAHNPWFLSNTKDVNYCIQINEKEFGQSKEFVRLQIHKAFDFWKLQLRELRYMNFGGLNFDFQVGTQNFRETNCNKATDIRFQFAQLDQEQKERLGDLSKTVAVSVRTDYDLQNLKGKGFVFFNKNEELPGRPWSRTEGSRVLLVAIHELGHIFGIQHDDDVWMMKENFPEELLEARSYGWTDAMSLHFNQGDNYKETHLFSYKPTNFMIMGCLVSVSPIHPKPIHGTHKIPDVYRVFFGQKLEDQCEYKSINTNNVFEFYSGKDNQTTALIGKAQLQRQNLDTSFGGILNQKNIIHFWIPPEQKVFQMNEEWKSNRVVIASYNPKQFFKGVYNTLDGKISRSLALEVSNSGSIVKVSGVMDGELFLDLRAGF